MILNRFLFFKTTEAFQNALRSGNIKSESIAFIKDRGVIWTHKSEFGGKADETVEKAKGYFTSLEALNELVPNPTIGDWAIVDNSNGVWYIAECEQDGVWTLTEKTYEHPTIDLSEYAKKSDLSGYATLNDLADLSVDVDLTPIQNQVNTNTGDIADLKDRLEAIEAAFGDDFDSIMAQYLAIKEFIENLDSPDLEGIINSINALTDRVEALENRPSGSGGGCNCPIVDSDTNGLMPSSLYDDLIMLRDTTIPAIQDDVAAIQLLISEDGDHITEIIEHYKAIVEFLESLGDSEVSEILDRIITNVSNLEQALAAETARAQRAEQDLLDRIKNNPGGDGTTHIFMTESEYNALTSYEKDALYFIVEDEVEEWTFGDVFPITFN